MGDDVPAFDVPDRPKRRFTATGGVVYEGETVFSITPVAGTPRTSLDELVASVLEHERYVSGDWFDLPRPVFLVYDRAVSTTFRVVVRSSHVELHLLPNTEERGLRAFYDALTTESECGEWTVDYRVSES